MKFKEIFFDLDGTLLNTGVGIRNCVCISLSEMGKPQIDGETAKKFVGPPLSESYRVYCGMNEDEVKEAVTIYRRHYSSGGLYEAEPYKGIKELLEKLQKKYSLYVVTAKPTEYSKDILKHFDMIQYFEEVYGATLDGVLNTKREIIEYAVAKSGAEAPLMVGDTLFDVLGAADNGIPSLAVLYGYGAEEGLRSSAAIYCAETVGDLCKFFE